MSRLLINEVPLMVLPTLAVKIGLNEAMFLQQLHYWIGRSNNIIDGRAWVYNSVEEWSRQFPFWSPRTIARIIASLERQKLIVAANYNNKGFDRTKWYTIDYAVLAALEKSPDENNSSDGKDSSAENSQSDNSDNENQAENLSGSMMMTKCPSLRYGKATTKALKRQVSAFPNEENQRMEAADVSGSIIMPTCPNEEPQGLEGIIPSPSGQNGTSITSSCHIPLGQVGRMEHDNLAGPIPLNNNRKELQEKTTTHTEAADDIFSSAAEYGISEKALNVHIRQYGIERVRAKFALLNNSIKIQSIKNPAGWLRMALEEDYDDFIAKFKAAKSEKAAALITRQEAALLRQTAERLANAPKIDENSPYYKAYKHHVLGEVNEDEGREGENLR